MATPRAWDIFCRVVDNYGDAGVCWRLARRLACKGARVRLWIDDLSTLEPLHPAVTAAAIQTVEGIEIRALHDEFPATQPAEVVIEAFGCGLPDAYAVAMANARPASLWIVLEYLSAESWVPAYHGLPSPHPRLNLQRFFFFPGFAAGTGGVLREPDLFVRRDGFGEARRQGFWAAVGHDMPAADAITVSLFAYESAPVAELLQGWGQSSCSIVAAVPEGRLLPPVLAHLGVPSVPARNVIERGSLQVRIIPFVSQVQFDELLWSCDVNFVRGEDSFVRAQWASRPFVWQIYPQEDHTHMPKLEAFLDRYCGGAPAEVRRAARALMLTWNGADAGCSVSSAWAAFAARREDLARHARRWAEEVGSLGDLADNLAAFCEDKLK